MEGAEWDGQLVRRGLIERKHISMEQRQGQGIYQLIVHHNESGVKFGDVDDTDSKKDFAMNVDFAR